jgi:hypothetical protein
MEEIFALSSILELGNAGIPMAQFSVYSLVLAISVSLTSTLALAQSNEEIEAAARQYVSDSANAWLESPEIVDAINEQNQSNADLAQAGIDKLDKTWRQEAVTGSGPMIDKVLGNSLSNYLVGVQTESSGLITEVFVMDNKGLNVGQSGVTSDYWQGDESKWQKTYAVGPFAVEVGEVELDESSQRFQVQVSVTIVDPANGKAIGAITIGLDAEGLLML